jgi:hypothetical protein
MIEWLLPPPEIGDILWCHFPDNINTPQLKARPALVISVYEGEYDDEFSVEVAYGTSQRISTLYRGEFAICKANNLVAYEQAGLSYDTKFDLKQIVIIEFTTQWFSVPPKSIMQTSKLGSLHISMMHELQSAYLAACN